MEWVSMREVILRIMKKYYTLEIYFMVKIMLLNVTALKLYSMVSSMQ